MGFFFYVIIGDGGDWVFIVGFKFIWVEWSCNFINWYDVFSKWLWGGCN